MMPSRGMGAVAPDKLPKAPKRSPAARQGVNLPKTNWESQKAINRPKTRRGADKEIL